MTITAEPPRERLVDLLGAASSGRFRFVFEDGNESGDTTNATTRALWNYAGRAAERLRQVVAPGGRVAVVLTPTPGALAVLIGCWRAGITPVSVPMPARPVTVEEYRKQIESLLGLTGSVVLCVEAQYLGLLDEIAVRAMCFEDLTGSSGARTSLTVGLDHDTPPLIQCSSGTTDSPKAIVIDQEAIAANVRAILEVEQPRPGDCSYSWLPLSHDMGLIGMCLSSWVAGLDEYAGTGTSHLVRPESFLRDPVGWLERCSAIGATITSCPPFALDMVLRRWRGCAFDLGRLRTVIVGSEMIRAESLRGFDALLASCGVARPVICPAYGLAEVTLAASLLRPGEPWASSVLDREASEAGRVQYVDSGDERAMEVVHCGHPLRGTEVIIAGDPVDGIGPIELISNSACSGYVGEAPLSGPVRTGDYGFVAGDGQVVVLGRTDDVVKVNGRTVSTLYVERLVEVIEGVRPGSVAVTRDPESACLAVVLAAGGDDSDAIAERVRRAVARDVGLSPRVLIVDYASIPRTPSGKLRRRAIAELLRH